MCTDFSQWSFVSGTNVVKYLKKGKFVIILSVVGVKIFGLGF
jgi:hypothetical protein